MAPKVKKQKEIVQDERFQAIVLTDSFQSRFMPLAHEHPRCLLPLANVPLIEYTLEFLANARVNEVYLMCTSHAEQIQEYVEKSKWMSKNSPFNISTVMSLESRSVGDTMRDLDNRGLITGDFLLVSGDVVTNIDFEKVWSFHRHKKSQDKDHISTMVLTPAGALHKSRSQRSPATFTLDRKTNRCIYYSDIPSVDGKQSSISLDPEILENVDEFVIRNDLIDCHVDICTPHVPQIFQDEFDYQTLRSDFLKGVLTSDLLKKTIYAYIPEDSVYAARAESFETYDAVSQDILARWTYPLVPDSNLLTDSAYSYEFNHVYKEDKVILAQSCKIGNRTAIGSNTTVGNGTSITKSVIGRNCVIGRNVKISNSYIWDNTIIEDNSSLDYVIVGANVKIGSNVQVEPSCVIGYDVVIGSDRVIPSGSRIIEKPVIRESFQNNESFSDSEDESSSKGTSQPHLLVNDIDLVGEQGVGVVYHSEDELDDNSDSESSQSTPQGRIIYQLKSLNVSDDSIASISNKKKKHGRRSSRSRRLSSTSMVSTDYEHAGQSDEEEDFEREAVATVERALDNNHDLDTALLELNTLRMSMNVTYHEVRLATTKALLSKIADFISTDTLEPKDATLKIFNHWGLLYKRQVFNDEEQVDLCHILQQQITLMDPSYNQIILFLTVRVLYELDILEEDNIFKWWDSDQSVSSDELIKVRALTAQFIEWLKDAEEESEEESD